ncbi:MAG TPA: hypothetical protein VH619_18510 [Verrucomicrobiae bacterium]|nr:hypothetical protein [Verrucomicrobiae bacterium]
MRRIQKHFFAVMAGLTLVVWITAQIILSLTPYRPPFTYLFVGFFGFALFPLFLINLGFVFVPTERLFSIAACILIIIDFFWITPFIGNWAMDREHRWFFSSGQVTYDLIVNEAMQRKNTLTSRGADVGSNGNTTAYGQTNAEGSVIVVFPRPVWLSRRHAIVYYSGTNTVAVSTPKGAFQIPGYYGHVFLPVTNHWYETVP